MQLVCKPFVFIRHGETPLNRDGLIGGRSDVPLTETGRRQAQDAQRDLAQYSWRDIVVSPMIRARQTAELALPGADYHIRDNLRERDWGDLEMCSLSQQPPYEETPPGGEPWRDFCQRVTETLNDVLLQYDRPLVIAHSGVYRVLRYLACGTPYGPRIGNVVPMWIAPAPLAADWIICPLEESHVC